MVSGNIVDITINEEFRAGQGKPKTIEEILHHIHNSEIPILKYWKSDSLHSLDKFREPIVDLDLHLRTAYLVF